MADVDAVSVCPTCAVPLIVGAPVAALLGTTATANEAMAAATCPRAASPPEDALVIVPSLSVRLSSGTNIEEWLPSSSVSVWLNTSFVVPLPLV